MLYNNDTLKTKKIEFEDMGSWWSGENEIDIVLKGRNKLFLGDVKWKEEKKVTISYISQFIEKKDLIDFNGTINFMFFSRAGFEKDAEEYLKKNNILFMDLKDIEQAFNQKAREEKIDQRTISGYFS